jgi:hypothetical protein
MVLDLFLKNDVYPRIFNKSHLHNFIIMRAIHNDLRELMILFEIVSIHLYLVFACQGDKANCIKNCLHLRSTEMVWTTP